MLEFLKALQSINSPFLDAILTIFNFFSQQYFLVLLAGVTYWVVDKKKGEALAYSMIVTLTISCGIKGVFKVPRPYNYDGIRVLNKNTAPGYSFPSADSSTAASIATTIGFWVKKPIVKTLLAFYVITIGFCRMYFGLHFPTDVIGGFIIGVIIAYCINKILDSKIDTNILNIILVATSLCFAFAGQEEDYYKAFGLLLGACVGIFIEHRFINFGYNISFSKKVLRLLAGIAGIIIIELLCSSLLPQGIFFVVLDKFLLTFFAVGIYPAIFKKLKF